MADAAAPADGLTRQGKSFCRYAPSTPAAGSRPYADEGVIARPPGERALGRRDADALENDEALDATTVYDLRSGSSPAACP